MPAEGTPGSSCVPYPTPCRRRREVVTLTVSIYIADPVAAESVRSWAEATPSPINREGLQRTLAARLADGSATILTTQIQEGGA